MLAIDTTTARPTSFGPKADITAMTGKVHRILALIQEGSQNGPIGEKTRKALKEFKELISDLPTNKASELAGIRCMQAYADKYCKNPVKWEALLRVIDEVKEEMVEGALKV
jgi:hypothetical protein